MDKFKITKTNYNYIVFNKPVDYLKMIRTLRGCEFVITDSGGIVEEAVYYWKPTITFRKATERPESVNCGCNIIAGTTFNEQKINSIIRHIKAVKRIEPQNPYKIEGIKASKEIAKYIQQAPMKKLER